MYIFIECWNANNAWTSLSKEERVAYFNAVEGAIGQLMEGGAEIISWSFNTEIENKRNNGFDYFAIWKFPNVEMVQTFQSMVEGAGWYNYFDQVNACGLQQTPAEVIAEIISQ